MKGERGDKDKDRDSQRSEDRQAEEEEKLVEKKMPNVILHSLHGVQGGRETEKRKRQRKKRGGMGEGIKGNEEEGDKRQSLAWRQAAFQYHPASDTDALTKSPPCKWFRRTSGDFPSPKIRADICPPPPTTHVQHRGRFPDKNSRRNYSNSAAFLLGVSADLRG